MSRRTGPPAATVRLTRERSGGMCERCGQAPGQHVHHRQPRGAGGTRLETANLPSNLLHLCRPCHEHVESHRQNAYAYGWLVPRYGRPAEWPVKLAGHGWVLLNDQGGWSDYDDLVAGVST